MLSGPLASAAAYVARHQRATCTVTRADPAGVPVFDPDTGTYTDPADLGIYAGACQVLPVGADRVVQFGDGATSLRQYDVTLNGLSETVHVQDTVTVASDHDPDLDGLELRVLDVRKSSLPTNRRLLCEEVIA